MASASPKTIPCPSPPFINFSTPPISAGWARSFLRPTKHEGTKLRLKPSRTLGRPSVCLTPESPTIPCGISASERLARLVSEFQSLPEPIDRVKRLLHYAAILPEFEESARVESNRVTGCTTQVWLDVGIHDSSSSCCRGRMRFRADSDSEITKGFCSCLIWVLDGAGPEEVLAVQAEDLGPMNMGVVAHSRVNTWHNVLVGMQRRTKGLLLTEGRDDHGEEGEWGSKWKAF
ncbi:sufE-like protein 2, chloroplastic [Punica granatum]|uniref:SufE-like protein 2, chloroplastic n=1 Tax=Punica granatum TaxID=22663 RepID=A0A218WUC6_PUNGR|nr:sufE-like protein 2, chloroplastic [Punica granatum]OWM76129.1 hypothetical protein CDL15_Pgr009775 [Punica granatum]